MRLTLREVIANHGRIEVPLLQRDYAQGRPTALVMRSRFLQAIYDALLKQGGDPLDLDFVYGVVNTEGVFAPLDGQQRLTTLFLLHWYLATLDGRGDDFRSWASVNKDSTFTYRVRPTATDFFNQLVHARIDLRDLLPPSGRGDDALSRTLRDQSWFYLSWERDPSVRGCLVVLDSIHQRFCDTAGLYDRLVSAETPAITFQFLDLASFALSDDLYIKMNARGKLLTDFETFKASLEGAISDLCPGHTAPIAGTQVDLRTYIAQRFDTAWCDLFWADRDEEHSVDVLTMNAIRAVGIVTLAKQTDPANSARHAEAIRQLRHHELHSFYDLNAAGCITPAFIDDLVALFDRWASADGGLTPALSDTTYYNEREEFRRFVRSDTQRGDALPYADWIRFVAWCLFRRSDHPIEQLGPWMRVVSNLAKNTIFNRLSEFCVALEQLPSFLDAAGADVITRVATAEPLRGFNRQQAREERIKAQLILHHVDWAPLLREAETHAYFDGQVEFLLSFSGVLGRWLDNDGSIGWGSDEDEALRGEFRRFLDRACAVFVESPTPGLAPFPEFLFERALLCEGDYLLPNSRNLSFLDSVDRELSWKRLLRADVGSEHLETKRDLVRVLLERVDPDAPEASLRARIDAGVAGHDAEFPGWRQALIARPELLAYCLRRQIRWESDYAIYLLTGVRRSGYHKELFTSQFFPRVRELAVSGALGPLRHCVYEAVATDTVEPRIVLSERAWEASRTRQAILEVTFVGKGLHVVPHGTGASSRVALERHDVALEDLERALIDAGRGWAGAAVEDGAE